MTIAWLDRRHARRGWAALIVACIAAATAFGLDYDFFGTDGQALALPGREWTLIAGDVPRTWSALEKSATFARAIDRAPEVRSWIDAWSRKKTGVRWTPLRWNLWLGRVLLVSGSDGAAVASVPATPLARGAVGLARAAGLVGVRGGVLHIAGIYLVQSGHFLIAGTSPDIVSRLQTSGELWSSVGGTGLSFDRTDHRLPGVFVVASNELEVSVFLQGNERPGAPRGGHFAMEWPEGPVLAAATRDFELWDPLLPENWPAFGGRGEAQRVWSDFEALLPEHWRAGADTTQVAIFDVDTSETVPVIDAAVYSRSETPLAPLLPPLSAIPYEWSGRAGWMTPWLGEGANLFVAADERSRVFANQERTMSRVMAHERVGRITSDDATLDIDASRLAGILSELARKAASNELWPERSSGDIEREVIPWMSALGALGEIRLAGKYENGGLTLRGGTQPSAVVPRAKK